MEEQRIVCVLQILQSILEKQKCGVENGCIRGGSDWNPLDAGIVQNAGICVDYAGSRCIHCVLSSVECDCKE